MKKIFTLIFSQLFCLLVFAQTPAAGKKEIDLSKIDYPAIEQIFYNKLNDLRKEKNAGTLVTDATLKLAANDQSAYMGANHIVTHDQLAKDKATPQLRVMFYKGTHDRVGENCIKILLKTPMKVKYSKNPVTATTIEEAAEALFLGWKNSPGHYKNMIEPGYDAGGLGFYFMPDSNVLYCAQVFSALPFVPKPGLESPIDAYGIKTPDKKVCDCMSTKAAGAATAAMILVRSSDSVYLQSENLRALKDFFNKPGDAYYVDLVIREQFVCANNNLLHGSELYDGTMLKPILFKDLFKLNRAKGNNFYAPICAIPPKIKKYKFDVNHGIIKEGHGCSYSWSVLVGGDNLKLLPLFPKWFQNPRLEVEPDTFKGYLDFLIPFERGKTKMDAKTSDEIVTRLKIYKPFVKQISIKTFSSVEGSTEVNLKLQKTRATEIDKLVQTVTGFKAGTEIESKENWEDFMNQLEFGKFAWMKKLSHEKIKLLLRDKRTVDSMDYLLKKTRIARLRIQIEAVVDENSSPYLLLAAYKRSIEKGDSLQAFARQNKLLKA
ncbi:MAG: CAP domain-containing protein, partial [Bacteroidia bacterium]|nr:CAP domain-containing protein [Bacteroidia bacterium]